MKRLQELWFDAYETWVFTHSSHGEFTGWLLFTTLPFLTILGLVAYITIWLLNQ